MNTPATRCSARTERGGAGRAGTCKETEIGTQRTAPRIKAFNASSIKSFEDFWRWSANTLLDKNAIGVWGKAGRMAAKASGLAIARVSWLSLPAGFPARRSGQAARQRRASTRLHQKINLLWHLVPGVCLASAAAPRTGLRGSCRRRGRSMTSAFSKIIPKPEPIHAIFLLLKGRNS